MFKIRENSTFGFYYFLGGLPFHKTILNEFYQVTFRKKLYSSLEELQKDLDEWMIYYNNDRTHQGKICCSRTPLKTLLDGNLSGLRKI